jgi:hypothetical protein
MSFRHDGRKSHAWNQWRSRHRDELLRCGVHPALLERDNRWVHFLEHGWDPDSGFKVEDLTPAQGEALEAFLVREYGDDDYSAAHVCITDLRRIGGRLRRWVPKDI